MIVSLFNEVLLPAHFKVTCRVLGLILGTESHLHVREGLEKLRVLSELLLDERSPVDLASVKALDDVGP